MYWWQWIIASVAAYFAIALIVSVCVAYYTGIKDGKLTDVDRAVDMEDVALCGLFWPLAAILVGLPKLFDALYEYGKNRPQRKLKRQSKKNRDQAFKRTMRRERLGLPQNEINAAETGGVNPCGVIGSPTLFGSESPGSSPGEGTDVRPFADRGWLESVGRRIRHARGKVDRLPSRVQDRDGEVL